MKEYLIKKVTERTLVLEPANRLFNIIKQITIVYYDNFDPSLYFEEGTSHYLKWLTESLALEEGQKITKLLDRIRALEQEIAELKAPKIKRPVWDSPPMSVIPGAVDKLAPNVAFNMIGYTVSSKDEKFTITEVQPQEQSE